MAAFDANPEAAAVEKRLFLGRGGAAEHGVAMRKAAEPADDVGVQLGPFHEVGVAGRAEQRDAALLVGERLGVLERQVEELPVGQRHCADRSRAPARGRQPRAPAGRRRRRARCRGTCCAGTGRARSVSASAPSGGLLPVGELAGGGGLVGCEEARADVVVERRVLLEPLVGPGRAPEREHGFGRRDHSRISPLSMRCVERRIEPHEGLAPADR